MRRDRVAPGSGAAPGSPRERQGHGGAECDDVRAGISREDAVQNYTYIAYTCIQILLYLCRSAYTGLHPCRHVNFSICAAYT